MKKTSHSFKILLAVLLILGLALAACGGGEPTPTPEPPPTDTPPPPPTDTPPPPPTDTPPPPPTDTPPPPPPTDTPPPPVSADFTTFESAEGGYAIQYPQEWFTSSLFGFTTLASNEALLDSPDQGEEGGVAIVVSGDSSEFSSAEPTAALTEVIADFDLAGQAEVTEGPTGMQINGQPGATAVIRGNSENGTPLFVYAVIVFSGDRATMMFAVTPAETEKEFRPTFEAMAQTIEVGEPVVVEEPPVVVPDSEGLLLYGDTITSKVTPAGPSVWTFLGVEGETIDIIVEPTDDQLDAVVNVVDAGGNSIIGGELDASFGMEEIRNLSLPSSGEFSILIRGFADSVGPYQLTIAEAGTAVTPPITGATISYGDTIPGTVTSESGLTWSFAGAVGDFVNVTAVPFDDFDLVLDVLGPNGLTIVGGPIDRSFDTEFIRALNLTEDGLYTIVVNGFEGTTGDVEVTLSQVNDGLPGSIVYVLGALDEADSVEGQAFPFTAFDGELITAYLFPEFDAVLQVYNDDTDELLLEVDDTTGFEEIVFTAPEFANYYFNVVGFEGGFGNFDLTLVGSDSTLFELAYGDEVAGLFNQDGVIEYAFNGTAGETLEVTVRTDTTVDLVLEIVDTDGNVLASADNALSGESETLTYTFEADDLFFIRVSDFFLEGGSFWMTLN